MRTVKPQVFHLGQMATDWEGLHSYLEAVGAPQWTSDAESGNELVAEVMGRICYRSFAVGLNPNVTKIRQGNAPYLKNVIEQQHGSVIEHAWDNWVLFNISRAVTHQIVRARVGVAYSQESLHYVRVEDIGSCIPSVIANNPLAATLYKRAMEDLEETQLALAEALQIDDLPFSEKKAATTAMRRLVPSGFATALGWTVNHRQLRFMIQQRTERVNDEEIRFVFAEMYRQASDMYPAFYFDAHVEEIYGINEITFDNHKI